MANPITILIEQAGQPAGTPGVSRDNMVVGQLATCTDPANSGGGGTWAWTLVTPNGSSTTGAGGTTDTFTFTPDMAGAYLVYLVYDDGIEVLSYVIDAVGQKITTQGGAGVKDSQGFLFPCFGETTQFGVRGWDPPVDAMLRSFAIGKLRGFGRSGEKLVDTIRAGDVASNASATPQVVSQFAFDPSEYLLSSCNRSLVFRAVAANGGGVAETKARLYSVTDAEYIGAGITFTSSSPTKQQETLTIGAGAGEVDDSEKVYEAHIWVVAPDLVDDTIELGSAELRLVNTVAAVGFGGSSQKLIATLRTGDVAVHDSLTPMVVSQLEFDPSTYSLAGCTRSIVFRAVASNGGGVTQTKVRVYSVTDAEYIGVGLTFTSAVPAKQQETLTIGSGAGEVDDTAKLYEVHIWVVSPDGIDDTIALGSAELRLINTID